jgi:hypothetical protein
MSAACALAEIANMATATRTLRINHSHPAFETQRDHRSLTLINRCLAGVRAKQNGAGTSRAVKRD